MAAKNFIPQTREEAVSEYVRVAVENIRIGRTLTRPDNVFSVVGRKMLAKARRVKRAKDWRAAMWAAID